VARFKLQAPMWSSAASVAGEVDASLWFFAISVVPIEGRLGIGLRL
jgi:hypothetical protein